METPDEIAYLTGRKMAEQDNRHTQYPLFVVRNKVKRYCAAEDAEFSDRYEFAPKNAICDDCRKQEEEGELPDQCRTDECLEEAFAWFNWEWVEDIRAGVFFTAEECERHLKKNAYHYHEEAHVYCVSAWRNPEMQAVMQHLIEGAGMKVPSHYR